MLKLLIAKFKETPGPMQATRIMVGDMAEELLEIAESYMKAKEAGGAEDEADETADPDAGAAPPQQAREDAAEKTEPARLLPVADDFARALDDPRNRKKQEFKVLAILWDAASRDMKAMSAQSVAEHGRKLGLAIRHENVRKVIRMRLDDQVEIMVEEKGTGSIYKYRISEKGQEYFRSKYLINQLKSD